MIINNKSKHVNIKKNKKNRAILWWNNCFVYFTSTIYSTMDQTRPVVWK